MALTRLAAAAAANPTAVRDVRGVGLMIGVELRDGLTAAAVQQQCFDEGLLVLTCGPHDNVLRLIPPLTITDDEFAQGLGILAGALAVIR
jgi:4-aminobutyrate aminotransferase-like enzyme